MNEPARDPQALIRLARAGDGTALGELLELYRQYLTLLARLQIGRRLQGKIDPADLVQETFLEAHRHFAQFHGNTEEVLVSWLRQILAGCLAHVLRRYYGTQRRNLDLERQLADELDRSSHALDRGLFQHSSSPSHKAARREQAVLLADAIARLPENYREVMILHHLEGLTLAETARRLSRTVDSVEKSWARALLQLRRLLGGSL